MYRDLDSPLWTAATLVGAGAATAAPVCGGSEEIIDEENINRVEFQIPLDGWLTGGPHFDALSIDVKAAIDIAPDQQYHACPSLEHSEKFAIASASGKVIISGNENDHNDPAHSVVAIEHLNGIVTGYMHLKNIQVEVGQEVEQGDKLGNPSCEVPPGGSTNGVHLHFFAANNQGDFIPVRALNLSGWRIHESDRNYFGTMTHPVLGVRTSDERRCGPLEESIIECGGIRNDLSPAGVLSYRTTPEATKLPQTTPTQPETAVPTSNLIDSRAELIDLNTEIAFSKVRKYVDLLKAGGVSNLYQALAMHLPENLRDVYVYGYKADLPDYDQLKICSDQMQLGEFQMESYSLEQQPRLRLSELEIFNRERGLGLRDRYDIGISFRYNEWNHSAWARTGFRDYEPLYHKTTFSFEDFNGELFITRNLFCMSGSSPLGVLATQPLDR